MRAPVSTALTHPELPRDGRATPLFLAASVLVHVVGFWFISGLEPPRAPPPPSRIEMVVVEVGRQRRFRSPSPNRSLSPEPPPPVVKPAPRPPPPIKVAAAAKPVEPPPDAAPPPPNDAPPPETPSKPVPLVVGISMSSTTSAGSFAAPVGNTVYGKTDGTAAKPEDVKAYSAPKYVPVYQVDQSPSVLREVKVEYPREAKAAGVEGSVVLSVTVDPEGKVVEAKIVKGGLGYGLDEAARFNPPIAFYGSAARVHLVAPAGSRAGSLPGGGVAELIPPFG